MTDPPKKEINLCEDQPEVRTPEGVVYRFTYEVVDDRGAEMDEETDRKLRWHDDIVDSGTTDPDELQRLERARLEILDAFTLATEHRDELIRIVGAAADADAARVALMAAFDLSEVQATAALDLQVRRFASYERGRIASERDDIQSRLESR